MLRPDLASSAPSPRRRRSRAVVLALLALLVPVLLATPLAAQGDAPQVETSVDELRQRYEVLELSSGWVLRPLDDGASFRLIEILDGEVRLDGEEMTRSELRRFVDADADRIFRLAAAGSPAAGSPEPPAPPATDEADEADERAEEIRRRIEEQIREQEERLLEEQERRQEAVQSELEEIRDRIEDLKESAPQSDELRRLTRRLERLADRPPAPRVSRDSQVSMGSGLRVERGERVRDAVVILGDLDVEGEVDGDATVVLGSAKVSGYVDGSVVSVLGRIDILPGGHIDGDAVAIGGGVHRQEGGRVDGEVIHMDFGDLVRTDDVHVGWPPMPPMPGMPGWGFFDHGVFELIGRIFRIAFLALLAMLVYVIAAKREESISAWVGGAPWRSVLVGLVVQVLSVPVIFIACILLMISVVGIPLALLLPFIAAFVLFVFLLMGYTAAALCLGDWTAARFGWARQNRYLVILLGIGLIEIWSVIGDAFGLLPFIGWLAWILLVLAFVYKYAVWTAGLGAVFLEFFSNQPPPPSAVPVSQWDEPDYGEPAGEPPPAPPEPGGYETQAYAESPDEGLLSETEEPPEDESEIEGTEEEPER